jgi:hypothetical protein
VAGQPCLLIGHVQLETFAIVAGIKIDCNFGPVIGIMICIFFEQLAMKLFFFVSKKKKLTVISARIATYPL